jgi:hypothetical protein
MRIAIRDDDISYFTDPKDLDNVYSDIWNYGPISMAVIPFDVETCGRGDNNSFKQTVKEFPVGENKDLVEYLKQKIAENKIYIMLHGYNHYYKPIKNECNPFGIPEFAYRSNQYKYLKLGKEYLEALFNVAIEWFIPPSNRVTVETINACDALGLNLPMLWSLRKRKYFSANLLMNIIRNQCARIINSNPPLGFKNHSEIKCITFSKLVDYRRTEKFVRRDNFVIATHYWEAIEYPQIQAAMHDIVKKEKKIYSLQEIITDA